jgi:hypothetical protein
MFDAIQGLVGGKKSSKGPDDLEAIVEAARGERHALATLLDEVAGRSATLTQTNEVLEGVTAKATAATVSTEALETRIQELEHRIAALAAVEDRVNALVAATTTAQRQIEKVVAPDGELERQRRHGRELAAQLSEAQALAAAIANEGSTFETCARISNNQTTSSTQSSNPASSRLPCEQSWRSCAEQPLS